jgi:hypothetical protein
MLELNLSSGKTMETSMNAVASLIPSAVERRVGKRVNQCFKVAFKALSDGAALGAYTALEARNAASGQSLSPDRIPASGENLSYGGLGLFGDLDLLRESPISEGSFLEMELEIPQAGRKLRCVGSVAWVKRDEAAGSFRSGVSFLGIDQADLALVGDVITRAAAPWRWAA